MGRTGLTATVKLYSAHACNTSQWRRPEPQFWQHHFLMNLPHKFSWQLGSLWKIFLYRNILSLKGACTRKIHKIGPAVPEIIAQFWFCELVVTVCSGPIIQHYQTSCTTGALMEFITTWLSPPPTRVYYTVSIWCVAAENCREAQLCSFKQFDNFKLAFKLQ